jgi:hypothetical protein
VLALPTLIYAGVLRHNALPAVAPFAFWIAWLVLRDRASTMRRRPTVTAIAVVILSAIVVLAQLLSLRVDRRVPMWPVIAQYDTAAISMATGRMLLPGFMTGPNLDLPELAGAFRIWSTTAMLRGTRHGMRDPIASSYSPEQLAALRHAWFGAIAEHPAVWIGHRWRLARALAGTHDAAWPRELVYVDAEVQYGDNPPIARNRGVLHRRLIAAAEFLRATPLLAAWPYLLAGIAAVPTAWRRRGTISSRLVAALLASAWLYALPFVVLAPAAEVRYLAWPSIASLFALVAAIAGRRESRAGAGELLD